MKIFPISSFRNTSYFGKPSRVSTSHWQFTESKQNRSAVIWTRAPRSVTNCDGTHKAGNLLFSLPRVKEKHGRLPIFAFWQNRKQCSTQCEKEKLSTSSPGSFWSLKRQLAKNYFKWNKVAVNSITLELRAPINFCSKHRQRTWFVAKPRADDQYLEAAPTNLIKTVNCLWDWSQITTCHLFSCQYQTLPQVLFKGVC